MLFSMVTAADAAVARAETFIERSRPSAEVGRVVGLLSAGAVPDTPTARRLQTGTGFDACYAGSQVRSMIRAALTAIAGIGLMLAQTQCAAACAVDTCSDLAKSGALPPCHRHHKPSNDRSPESCVHQNLAAPAVVQPTVQVEFPSPLDSCAAGPLLLPAIPAGTGAGTPGFPIPPPSGAEIISFVVLRI